MHEFLLFGQIPSLEHTRALQQLAGVTRMQPKAVTEIRLVYKAKAPSGLSQINSIGASQDIVPPEVQKTRALLASSLFYIQLVGEKVDAASEAHSSRVNGDVVMDDGDGEHVSQNTTYRWRLEFRDIPDTGKLPVTIRLMYRVPIEDGDIIKFLADFGFEYVSRYAVAGSRFYDHDTTFLLHKVLQLPQLGPDDSPTNVASLPKEDQLSPLDSSNGYVLQVSVEAVDGNNPELKERAIRQLTSIKETFKQSISLAPGDRLALDTRVPIPSRRP